MADLAKQLDQVTHAWTTLTGILGCDPHGTADDVYRLARQLVADRSPDVEQLLWDAVPEDISRAELERRITLAMRHLHYSFCGHTSTAFLILRDGVEPATPSRCAPKVVPGG